MVLKLGSLLANVIYSFGVLQIYMVLKPILHSARSRGAFRVLQIYMVLKRMQGSDNQIFSFRVLQIYMVLKLQKLPLALVKTF